VRGTNGAPGLNERCSACTSVDSLTARALRRSLSGHHGMEEVRDSSPLAPQQKCQSNIFDLERPMIVLCDRGASRAGAVRSRSAASSTIRSASGELPTRSTVVVTPDRSLVSEPVSCPSPADGGHSFLFERVTASRSRFRQAVVGRGGNRRSLYVSVAVQTCIGE
jgi:hypothetical protein